MGEVSCIGLGQMGSALARRLHAAGQRVTLWNRSPGRAEALRGGGAAVASSLAEAVAASPVVVVCIDSHAATAALFADATVQRLLPGKVIVEFSTGTPKEATEAAGWFAKQGAGFLDGAILAGPGDIGGSAAAVYVAGDPSAWAVAQPVLAPLSGALAYLGAAPGAAAALDLAWLTLKYGQFLALAHAGAICRAEGVALDALAALFPDDPGIRKYLPTLRDQSFKEFTASLQVWAAALVRVQAQARDAGIPSGVPDGYAAYFDRAIAAGFGQENVMALAKVL